MVAEAYGLISPGHQGENFSFALHTLPDDGRSISRNIANKHNDSNMINSVCQICNTVFLDPLSVSMKWLALMLG